jgi:hypothetical protein
MKKYLYLIFVLLGLTFYGCVSQKELQAQRDEETRKVMDSWTGAHKSKLIQSWGPPTRYDSDGQGGEILIYEYTRTVGAYVYGSYMQRTFVDYKEMFANKEGIIYYWRTGRR